MYLALACPEGWVENGNQCYFILPEKKEAFVGLYLCRQLEATLPIIKSAEENAFLLSLTKGKHDPWLGIIGPNGDKALNGSTGRQWPIPSLHGIPVSLTVLEKRTVGTSTSAEVQKESGMTITVRLPELLSARRRKNESGPQLL